MLTWLLLVGLASTACEDERADVVFDPARSFVRFNVLNTNTQPARDTLVLRLEDLPTGVAVPIALSSPPRTERLVLTYILTTTNWTLGTDAMVMGGAADGRLVLAPGQFDDTLRVALAVPTLRPAQLRFELTSSSDPAIHLGFPGPAARGRTFVIMVEP